MIQKRLRLLTKTPASTNLALALSVSLYLLTHLVLLGTRPGFHFDEAWAANFALRIAREPGFWPFQAMSAQTHAWHHYGIAALFKLVPPSVFAFRLLHVLMGLVGVLLIGWSAQRISKDLAGSESRNENLVAITVALAALQPALMTNHRFAIELTSFHALCFGGMLASALNPGRWGPWVSVLFTALGVSSHVFFIAPAVALLITLILENPQPSRTTKAAIGAGLCLGLLMAINLHATFPEKEKSWALVALLMATSSALAIRQALAKLSLLARWKAFENRIRPQLAQGIRILSVVALPFFLLLFEGSWSILAHTGFLTWPALAGLGLLPLAWSAHVLIREYPRFSLQEREGLRKVTTFLATLACCTLVIAPKPTPRYYECLFLASVGALALMSGRMCSRILPVCFSTWTLILGVQWGVPAIKNQFVDRPYR
ncbi:MAG: hypothetical protein RJB38_2404, partial [Pseudomonadota bacterium]